MNKHTLIIIVGIIIVVIGAFFIFTNRAEAPMSDELGQVTNQVPAPGSEGVDEMVVFESNEDTTSLGDEPLSLPQEQTSPVTIVSVTIVTFTDEGFSPETVTILRGDIVRFVNESSDRMWVGSDIHPTHSLYPTKSSEDCLGSSFDQCRASVNGESWEFTFDSVGEWRYHNHVRASKRGTIIVK